MPGRGRNTDWREAQGFLNHTFRRLFMPILEEHGERAPALREVGIQRRAEYGEIVLTARFERGPEYHVAIRYDDVVYRLELDFREFCDAVARQAGETYSRMFEDHLMFRRRLALRQIIERAQSNLGPGSERMLSQMMYEADRHLHESERNRARIRFPIAVRSDLHDRYVDEIQADFREESYTVERRDMTATEVRERTREIQPMLPSMVIENQHWEAIMRQFAAVAGLGGPEMEQWLTTIGSVDSVGGKAAQEKGMALLKSHLSAVQRAQFDKAKHFDVIGSDTGKTYRIHEGRQQNIAELNAKGRSVHGWCFLPQGNLVAGDVMLAQKAALSLFEKKALKIANKFAIYPGSRLWSGPVTQEEEAPEQAVGLPNWGWWRSTLPDPGLDST